MCKSTNGRYHDWLFTSLAIIEERGKNAVRLQQFEKLNSEHNLYAIRNPKSKLNPRVIYIHIDGDKIVLLCCFKEKKRSDYKKGIEKAISRKKLLKGNGEI